jgi:hypothetical protein
MIRFAPVVVALALSACAANYGGPKEIEVPTVSIEADADAAPAAVASAIRDAGARAAFVFASRDAAWFRDVAAASQLELSGPAVAEGLGMAFLAPAPLGDTTVTLEYEGGSIIAQDALYEIEEERYLDLIALRLDAGAPTEDAVAALLQYVATDVGNAAALVMAVRVPDAATGERVARMLAPAYFAVLRCGSSESAGPAGEHVRVFYGPAARMFCADASEEQVAAGRLVRARLIMGRR